MEIIAIFFVVVNFKSGDATGLPFFSFDLCNPADPFPEDNTVLIQSWVKAGTDDIAFCQNDRSIRVNRCLDETAKLWQLI